MTYVTYDCSNLVEENCISCKILTNRKRSCTTLQDNALLLQNAASSCNILPRNVFLVKFFQIRDFLQGFCRYLEQNELPGKILQQVHFQATLETFLRERNFSQLE